MKLGLRILLVLVGIWLVAGSIVWIVRASKPTPASLERYIAAHPIDNKSSSQRREIIDKMAAQLNRLTFEERRAFRQQNGMDRLFNSLTPEERARFLDLTLPEGFRQLMQALNKMKPEQRKKIVERALAAMESNRENGDGRPPIDSEQQQKIVTQGMSAFYEQASADVKLDFAPLIEQMQRSLQHIE
jgi:hypothetical protein